MRRFPTYACRYGHPCIQPGCHILSLLRPAVLPAEYFCPPPHSCNHCYCPRNIPFHPAASQTDWICNLSQAVSVRLNLRLTPAAGWSLHGEAF